MIKYSAIVMAILLFLSDCPADTFTHSKTGKTFNGYATSKKNGSKTQVRVEKRSPQYLNLSEYKIEKNHLGRKKQVYTFYIRDEINLVGEAEAFEKAIASAANQGPLFILISIDVNRTRFGLAQRICSAIIKTDNCETIAFVSGGSFNGAFSEGAIIAMACNKVYMHLATAIGAGTNFSYSPPPKGYGKETDPNSRVMWRSYSSGIAELNDRPVVLVKAMDDADIEVVEVQENGKHSLIDIREKKQGQTIISTLSRKGELLRLTAAQAVQYGIADKLVTSQEELLANMEAEDARLIKDNSLLRARRKFKRDKRTLDRIMSNVNSLEKRAEDIAGGVQAIELELAQLNEILVRGRFGITEINPNRQRTSDFDIYRRANLLLTDRDDLLYELLDVLNNLIRNYRKAIPAARRNPDLRENLAGLEQDLESARNQSDQVRVQLTRPY